MTELEKEQDKVTAYITKGEKWKLKAILAGQGKTITEWLRGLILQFLKKHEGN